MSDIATKAWLNKLTRDELIERVVGLGFLRDAISDLSDESLRIVWLAHTTPAKS